MEHYNDAMLEQLWHEFGDIPMNPETEQRWISR